MGKSSEVPSQKKLLFADSFSSCGSLTKPSKSPGGHSSSTSSCERSASTFRRTVPGAVDHTVFPRCSFDTPIREIDPDGLSSEAESKALLTKLKGIVTTHPGSTSPLREAVREHFFRGMQQSFRPISTRARGSGETEINKKAELFLDNLRRKMNITERQEIVSEVVGREKCLSSENGSKTNSRGDSEDTWWGEGFFPIECQDTITTPEEEQVDKKVLIEKWVTQPQCGFTEFLEIKKQSIDLIEEQFTLESSDGSWYIFHTEKIEKSLRRLNPPCPLVRFGNDVFVEHFSPSPADEGPQSLARRVVKNMLSAFLLEQNCFSPSTSDERVSMISDIHRIAAFSLEGKSRRNAVLEIGVDPLMVSGDLRGSFTSLYMHFSSKVSCGEWWRPSVAMLYLGGYSGECEHSVEAVALLLALQVLYPHRISMLHSRLDEEEVTSDLSNSCSLRVCCRKFCNNVVEGDALWKSLTAAVCATPAAAVIQHIFFSAHVDPCRCRDATPNDAETPCGGSRSLLAAYCRRPRDVLSHSNMAAVITAGPFPECHEGVVEHFLEHRILYFTGDWMNHKGHKDAFNASQACCLSNEKITVYRRLPYHFLNDHTRVTARLS